MYHLASRALRSVLYRLAIQCDTARYSDTAIQRDTSNLMYHPPSAQAAMLRGCRLLHGIDEPRAEAAAPLVLVNVDRAPEGTQAGGPSGRGLRSQLYFQNALLKPGISQLYFLKLGGGPLRHDRFSEARASRGSATRFSKAGGPP